MTYSYDGTAVRTNPLYKTRRLIGDFGQLTDDSGAIVWLMSDEEILGFIETDSTQSAAINEGIALCCDALAIQFAQEPDSIRDESGTLVNWSKRISQWNTLASNLRKGIANSDFSLPVGAARYGQITPPDMSGLRP